MRVKDALLFAVPKLKENNIELPQLEARVLLAYIIGRDIEYLIKSDNVELTKPNEELFVELINRRLNSEPIAYILGFKEFYGRTFEVNDKVLIPRPDTEVLVDAVLNADINGNSMLELGVGSGCIIITLLLERPMFSGVATDISSDSLLISSKNAFTYNMQDKIQFISSDWFKKLKPQKFDAIISNPPYVPLEDKPLMSLETRKFEPELALFSTSADGLSSYIIIARNAKRFLKPQGKVFLEVGFNQAERVIQLFKAQGFVLEKSYKDLAGFIRVVQFNAVNI